MDAIRVLIAKMEQDEANALKMRNEQSANTFQTAVATGLVTAAVALMMVVAFVWLLERSLLARHRAAAAIDEQREWFRTTLASIGDAVIATDAEGTVRFMNPVAQTLTDWQEDDARGRATEAGSGSSCQS